MPTKKSIYASRLFKYSKHQDRIIAAINNPINSELVSQLSEYVDLDSIDTVEPEVNVDTKINSNEPKGNNLRPGPKSKYTSTPSSINNESFEEPKNVDDNESEDNLDNEPEENLDASVSTTGSPIQANTVITNDGNRLSTDSILSTVNSLDTSSGAARVSTKDDNKELWIYYSDSINLNNVMTSVIELLDNSGYYYLTFNRLARTDNAIVFDVNINTSSINDSDINGDD